ncbi:hypothetical protein [Collinsella aerofaciens]|uniref:hypothetical protein n=1 Tax=Collinsella aerofaciens TaxID=74426 RepID=UPI0006C5EE24|nr:hypothetical protein [Collinsella aerofaciens]CUN84604.1 Uncharacterised protein [Collinsella aerofaciens]
MNIDIKTADGEEIEFGGSYYDGRGTEHRVVGIRLTDYRRITKVSLSCLVGKVEDLCCVSMRPNELYSTPPESWERLEEDLRRASERRFVTSYCRYFNATNRCVNCPIHNDDGCGAHKDECAFGDILDRIRKLRGEDDA